MKLVAMLRVKNQISTIEECLSRLSELVDEIVIVDNGSTDGTLKAYSKFKKIVNITKTKGFNEGRDKILAHEMAKARNPDWIIWIDGDEIFESSISRDDFEKYMTNPNINQVTFRMYNFWKSRKHYRIDGKWLSYTAHPQRSLWRNCKEAYFRNLLFHNGDIRGISGKKVISYHRLKHFGFITKNQIKQRVETYKKLEHLKSSEKTLSNSEDKLKTILWIESSNRTLNKIIQLTEHSFFSFIRFLEKLIYFFSQLSQTKG